MQDGRIHPARIEKEVEKAQEEVEKSIKEAGEQAVIEVGLQGLHPEIIKLLGRLKYRTSYGQNQLAHAVEATHIAAMLAAELGANVQLAKMGALLHDLGKAVSHEVEGAHAQVGADIAKRYGVPAEVVNIIASHHHEVEQQSVEAVIATTADAISGSRPGARREALETYVKRIKALEDIGNSFAGVAADLRHPGRARGPRHRQARGDRRPGVPPAGEGHRQEDRGQPGVSGADQGDGGARDAGADCEDGEVDRKHRPVRLVRDCDRSTVYSPYSVTPSSPPRPPSACAASPRRRTGPAFPASAR